MSEDQAPSPTSDNRELVAVQPTYTITAADVGHSLQTIPTPYGSPMLASLVLRVNIAVMRRLYEAATRGPKEEAAHNNAALFTATHRHLPSMLDELEGFRADAPTSARDAVRIAAFDLAIALRTHDHTWFAWPQLKRLREALGMGPEKAAGSDAPWPEEPGYVDSQIAQMAGGGFTARDHEVARDMERRARERDAAKASGAEGAATPGGEATDLAALCATQREEIADLRQSVIAFGAPAMVRWSRSNGYPPNHLYAVHYDILERAGACMDSFVRAAPEPDAEPGASS